MKLAIAAPCTVMLLMGASTADAIVIRHDVPDAEYRVPASTLPALVDMPGEGHGVLVAPEWVLTVAHVASAPGLDEVVVAGEARKVERVLLHPGYRRTPEELVQQALASGDAAALMDFLSTSDDIALVRLSAPVADVAPLPLYRGDDEAGRTVELVGKGATGDGMAGLGAHASHRVELRRAFNVVADTGDRWMSVVFDAPPSGLPLEGIGGNGDSGAPLLVDNGGQRFVAGLHSWDRYYAPGGDRPFHAGRYGQIVCSVRVSRYIAWIEAELEAAASPTSRR